MQSGRRAIDLRRELHRGLALCALLSALIAGPSSSAAQTRTPYASLTWTVPDDAACIERDAVAEEIEARIGRPVFVRDGAASVELRVEIVRDPRGRFGARIVMRGAAGEDMGSRELLTQERACRGLDRALALMMAMMLERLEAEATLYLPEEPPPPATPPPNPEAPANIAPPRPRAPATPPRSRPTLRVEVGVGAWAGALPELALALEVEAGLDLQPLPLALSFSLVPNARAESDGRGGDFTFGAATLALCPQLVDERPFDLALCALGTVGLYDARGFGLATNTRALRVLVAPGVAARASVVIADLLRLGLGIEISYAVARPRFVYDTSVSEASIFEPGPLLAHITLTVGPAFR